VKRIRKVPGFGLRAGFSRKGEKEKSASIRKGCENAVLPTLKTLKKACSKEEGGKGAPETGGSSIVNQFNKAGGGKKFEGRRTKTIPLR